MDPSQLQLSEFHFFDLNKVCGRTWGVTHFE